MERELVVEDDSRHLPALGVSETVPDDRGHLVTDVARNQTRVRALDFSQPTKFTAELRRRITHVVIPFCEAVSIRWSAELRTPVELRLVDSSQLTWTTARARPPANSMAVALEAQPIEHQMLLSVEVPLILHALERLLGGGPTQAPSTRRLTEIDWALTRRLLDSMVNQLSLAWRDLGGLELALREISMEGDARVFAPISEPTFLLTLESVIDGVRSTMSLLIPWTAIEPVADEILGSVNQVGTADLQGGLAVHRGLAGAEVLLRAEIGSVQMPLERVLTLTPGTSLGLRGRADEGVHLYAEGVALGRGDPGRRGARRSVKLTTTMQPTGGGAPGGRFARAQRDRAPSGTTGYQAPPSLALLRNVPVRVWAELGRTSITLGRALELPEGTVVELDQEADAPIELFVNGMCFAHGELLVTSDAEWAVRVQARPS